MRHGPLILICVAAFLAPFIGGQVYLGARPLTEGFLAELRGASLPLTAHALLGVLVFAGLIWTFLQRRVVQFPSPYVLFPIVAVIFTFGLASATSAFRSVSWAHWLEWFAMSAGLVAVVAIAGRDRGPKLLLWAILAGCGLTAIEGILEYVNMRTVDPTWRIFSSWINPNALAGMLILGALVGLALTSASTERLEKLGSGALTLLIGFAFVLTQSKGGMVGMAVGVVTFGTMLAGIKQARRGGAALVPLVAIVLLAVALRASPAQPGGASAVSRLGNASGTAEQSEGFRTYLWRSSVDLIQSNPFGYGLGTFRMESARPGLTPQTHFAHQGFLQIGVEAGVLGLLAWLGLAAGWFYTVGRGIKRLAADRGILLSGVIAAVVGCGAHNLFDSDWQHFGIGFTFFILLGIGMQLAADGSSPEFVPPRARVFGLAGGCALLVLALVHSSAVEWLKATSLTHAFAGNREGARGAVDRALALAPTDGDGYRVRASVDPTRTGESLRRAADFAPDTRNLRALARYLASQGDANGARAALNQALERDPNNLPALLLMVNLADQKEDQEGVERFARRMIAVEAGPYFKIRAIPELVPTETYEARLILAQTSDDASKLRLEALTGFAEYFERTVPAVRAQIKAGGDNFAGETAEDVATKTELARQALAQLTADPAAPADEVARLATRVESALGAPLR